MAINFRIKSFNNKMNSHICLFSAKIVFLLKGEVKGKFFICAK